MSTDNHHINHQQQKELRRKWHQLTCMLLMQHGFRPQKVADWGCGYGFFLNQAKTVLKAAEIRGFDGAYIDIAHFDAPADAFQPVDLNTDFPVYPCDLAVCLEVAEHLAPAQSDRIVANLCQSSNVVLFSAAIPHQEGLGHINCQYPSFWAHKFLDHGFVAVDALRPFFWANPAQAIWFRQNMMLFIELKTLMRRYGHLLGYARAPVMLDTVHPQMWESLNRQQQARAS